ncbi:hypothetical protein DQ384_19935 [Sphaerisporangium album]|uniref:Uncharacterized protein n=1 Tax=Sphaerisporangium album TaxID=509200 RepID=A0A367FHE2_9ACTN|nr:hypothetical protein [Sphaerisporangium album]RCG29339.1 hypothetical protein DQ384_19935 [Sphaerisporangium album]
MSLCIIVLVTSAQTWVRYRTADFAEVEASLWEVPGVGVRAVGDAGICALWMLALTVALMLFTAFVPRRPAVAATCLAATLSALYSMWLHQAVTRAHDDLVGTVAWVAPGWGAVVSFGEMCVLVAGLGVLTAADAARRAPGRHR